VPTRTRRLFRALAAATVTGSALVAATGPASAASTVPAAAVPNTAPNTAPRALSAAPDPSLGTAEAVAGQVDLDLQLLGSLLGSLHLTGSSGLDVPLVNLVLGQASAPTAAGDAANFSNSVLRLRDDLISTLHLPGQSADLLKADVASGTARVVKGPGGYAQAYATVANLRLFLPLLVLPGADAANGILKIDAVSAQATCAAGQAPAASAKLPTTIQLLGKQIPVPLTGDIPLDLGVAKVDVHLSPVTTTDKSGASAAVEARISIDAVGLAKVSGAIILASAKCTSPSGTQATGQTSSGTTGGDQQANAGTSTTPAGTSLPAAPAADAKPAGTDTPLAETGAPMLIWPLAGVAVLAILGGIYLVRLRKKMPGDPDA
jgi:hypothetical protein